jgi:hypothetical protein
MKSFKLLPRIFVLTFVLLAGYLGGLTTSNAFATANMRLFTEFPLHASTDAVVRARKLGSSESPGAEDDWVVIEVFDGTGTFLGQPLRIHVDAQGFITGDTPGVSGSYFRTNGSGQIQLVGR